MGRKKSKPRSKLTRIATRPSKKDNIITPKHVEGPLSGPLLRCKNWLLSQKGTKYSKNFHNPDPDFTENIDLPPVQTDSLAAIKYRRTKEITKNVFFACEWKYCLKEFEKEDDLCEHIVEHVISLQPYKDKYCCEWDLCYFETQCNSEITRHIHYHAYHTVLKTYGESLSMKVGMPPCTKDSQERNTIPELSADFECLWDNCEQTFKSISKFHKHVHMHCTFKADFRELTKCRKDARYICGWEFCNKIFPVKYRLIEHARKHSNEKLIGCFHCGSLFKTNTTYFDHCKRQISNNTQEYQCVQCFKYFATERLLRVHVLTHINCFKCSLCDITCNSVDKLARHVRYKHIKDKPLKCAACDFRAVNKIDLSRHMLQIHENKVYECGEPDCNYKSKSLFLLKKHDAEKHEDSPSRYACHCCDNVYTCGVKLSKHLTLIHGFQVPFGYGKFTYRMDEQGVYRLQTTRIESLEASKQSVSEICQQPKIVGDVTYEVSETNDSRIKIGLSCKVVATTMKNHLYDFDDDSNDTGSKMTDISSQKARIVTNMSELLEDPVNTEIHYIDLDTFCTAELDDLNSLSSNY